ncbi:MAG: hypothetical protein WBA93_21395 [Microcoleaceae cyanobacterium]
MTFYSTKNRQRLQVNRAIEAIELRSAVAIAQILSSNNHPVKLQKKKLAAKSFCYIRSNK